MISVIIPTFNEEKNLTELIPHLLNCNQATKMEIIVCDATPEYEIDSQFAQDKKIRFIKSPKASRSYQLNYGASEAKFDILYFLHADARPPLNFISTILTKLEEGYLFGIFSYKFNSKSPLLRFNSFFTKYDGLFAGGGDQSLFIKKEIYDELGGFDTKLKIMEDFEFYKRAKKSKYRYTIIKDPLTVSARKYEHNNWLKVNYINLRIFVIYLFNGSEEQMIRLNKRLGGQEKANK